MMTVTEPESIQAILKHARQYEAEHSGEIIHHKKKNGQANGESLQYTGPTFKNLGAAGELPAPFRDLLTREELAHRLKQTAAWINEKRRPRCKNPIPAVPIGRTILFDWNSVVKWLEKCAADDVESIRHRRMSGTIKTRRKAHAK